MKPRHYSCFSTVGKTIALAGCMYLPCLTGADPVDKPEEKPIASEQKEKQSGPKVESKTRSRKGAVPIQRAVIEGDLDEVLNGVKLPSSEKNSANQQAAAEEDANALDRLPPMADDDSSENIYVPIQDGQPAGQPTEKNEGDVTTANGATPADELILPEIARQSKTSEPYRSISTSQQFLSYGEDNRLCSFVTGLCEEVKSDFLAVMKEKDAWKYNISIKLIGKFGDPVVTNPVAAGVVIIGGMPFFELKVQVGQGLDSASLRTYLTEMLMYERCMRRLNLSSLPETTRIPAWLVAGVNEAMLWKHDLADRNLYASLFARGEVLTLEQLFKTKDPQLELDASSYGVYRASCGALISSLLNQSGGQEAFYRMMDQSVFSGVDGETLLKQNFPALSISNNSLYKWWALQLSNMATQPMTESLNMLETEQKLEEYSHVPYYHEKMKGVMLVGPEDYKLLMTLTPHERRALLQPVLVNLVQLSYRAFPHQRDLVIETIRLVERIMKDKLPSDMDARLQALQVNRKLMSKVGTRARDYLDWHTIVNATHTSGSFNSYLQTMSLLREKSDKAVTPLSKYLDDMEKLVSPSYSELDE